MAGSHCRDGPELRGGASAIAPIIEYSARRRDNTARFIRGNHFDCLIVLNFHLTSSIACGGA
jgi:hypothetical protein